MSPSPRSAVIAAERVATAWHEAGHVVAYFSRGLSVRYATLRPRDRDALGRTVVPRRTIPVWDMAVIAHAGSTAQGMYAWRTRDADEDDLDEADYIGGAYLTGGACDLLAAAEAPALPGPDGGDFWEWSAKGLLESYWAAVAAVAEALLSRSTVEGAVMRQLAVAAGMPQGMVYGWRGPR